MVGNLPLSVSMLHDCLGYPLVSFPFISKHLRPKNVSEMRSVHKSLALRYLRNLFSSFHIVTKALYEITLPKNTLRPHTLPDRFSPNSIPYKSPIASLCPFLLEPNWPNTQSVTRHGCGFMRPPVAP